jgi:hypothetical protein
VTTLAGTATCVAALVLTLTACGSTGGTKAESAEEKELGKAADRSTCLADATPVSGYPDGFPKDFPFPDKTVVFDVEDRGSDGVIATGITSLPFKNVLAALNGRAQDEGFKVTGGETEEHDAEASWTGERDAGRWTIRESATCPGETVIQVLAYPAG